MDIPKTNGIIVDDANGVHYEMVFAFVPHVGDGIKVYSHADAAQRRPHTLNFEVTSVVHDMQDLMTAHDRERPYGGSHSLIVHVKPTGKLS